MTKLFKRIINFLLKHFFSFGVGKIIRRINKDKITILSMHGVMNDHSNILWKPLRGQLDPELLDHNIKVLSENYTFISLQQAYNILSGNKPPVKNGLVFTLDDGYWNNLNYAGPIFKKYNVLPTIFVATKNINECSPFWFDRFDYALQQIKGDSYNIQLLGDDFSFDLSSRNSQRKSYALFREIIKGSISKDEDMRNLLDSISSDIEVMTGKSLSSIIQKDDWTRIASWEELNTASCKHEFNVGSHTVDHIRIALVDDKVAEYQLQESKKIIEKKLNVDCHFFCYPNGSYNGLAAQKTREAGYLLAVTTEMGLNKIGDDLMTLNRFSFPNKRGQNDILHAISTFKF